MWTWFKRLSDLGEAAMRFHALAWLYGVLAAIFAAGVAAMTWVTKSIAQLSDYGWGLPVLIAIGVVLIILIVLSFVATPMVEAYIRFRRHRDSQTGKNEAVQVANMPTSAISEGLAELDRKIDELRKESETFESLATKAELADRLNPIAADIARFNDLGVSLHSTNESFRDQFKELRGELAKLQSLVESNRKQSEMVYEILSKAIRARDAESIIKEADQQIISIGKKLLEESYPDEAAWADAYTIWEKAMTRIDNVLSSWQKEHYTPFLDIRRKDFEGGTPSPSNIKSDQNIIRYKTVWLAQPRYANIRENIFIYFSSKAGELPG